MSKNIHQQRILVIDFGSPLTQLIGRKVRQAGVYCEIFPYDAAPESLAAFGAKGIILSCSDDSVFAEYAPQIPAYVLQSGLPVLAIGSSMLALAMQFGSEVSHTSSLAYQNDKICAFEGDNFISQWLEQQQGKTVLIQTGENVLNIPAGFVSCGASKTAAIAAIANTEKHLYGVKFHLEDEQSEQGAKLLEHFVLQICGCDALWTAENIIDDAIDSVRKQVGNDHVILGLSGGVDSSVVAALLHRAIGDQLTCVFVDHGLLRLHEGDQVMQMFAENMGIKVIRADKEELFLGRLAGVTDPEQKRKIIGNTFIEVFDEEAAKISNAKWLAQGTIYPDVIESIGSKHGKPKVVKSHHNVGGLPDDMALNLIEPLRELFKDEVRKIGIELGLPYDMVYRHPFPGPGLGVRILGEVKKEYADVLRQADAIFIEELHKADWYHKTSQAFAVFNPVKSVGVVDEERRYAWVVVLRAVETIDFMTARWAHLPYELLETVSSRIINEIPEVSRVAYDVSSKPPATIEWE